jgi:shikimate kinase
MMLSSIILIGPFGAGKSTIGELLAQQLGLPNVSLDSMQHYYRDLGFDHDEFARVGGFEYTYESYVYFQTFFPGAVERLLAEHPGAVIDLGAGHTVYDDPEKLAAVKRLLHPYPNVILLLPSPDPDESVRVLKARVAERQVGEGFRDSSFDYFDFWVRHPSNRELAKFVVYTEGKTPQQTAGEVRELLGLR